MVGVEQDTEIEGTDEELLLRLQAGDENAFTLLYRRRQGAIYRFALHMTGSHTVADDVTQEVFLALLMGRVRFDATRGQLAPFLFGVARNLVLKRLRGLKEVAAGRRLLHR